MLAVGILFFILAFILLVVGGLATARKLPGNNVVGLRLVEIRKTKEAWDNAHAVAGPFWLLGGVALVFGGLVALRASGWMWLIPVVTFIVAVLALSIGSNMGARAAYLWDQAHQEEEGCGESCNCGDGGCGSGEADTPAPAVDLDALRKAAEESDKN
ncbi:SdpI family protein [Corynebacterium sp.]|uniref:SdpI family protein n=1 Tax=Corynebacterium sp. TaxID=1720 RepID=UPI0026DC6644|nr:SdpI family protein [Corynebacterium sp.]MDO5032215.1 SdpI family protein [Corynebacterium sp.]